MNKKYLLFAFVFFGDSVFASTWCSGQVTNIRLNTDYNNDQIAYTVNGVFAVLEQNLWSDKMQDKVLSIMLAAQLGGKSISYWGSDDCTLIKNRLSIVDN